MYLFSENVKFEMLGQLGKQKKSSSRLFSIVQVFIFKEFWICMYFIECVRPYPTTQPDVMYLNENLMCSIFALKCLS